MSARTLAILAVAGAVFLLLAVLGERSSAPPARTSELLLPGLADVVNDLEEIKVVKAGNETVATLHPAEDGWTVAERDGYPADLGKLRQSLRALAEARIVEQKTATPELYERLGVEDVADAEASGVAVSFSGPGAELPTVIIGDAEGGEYRYVRRAGEATSWLIDRNPDFPRSTEQWLDRTILDVRGDRVQQVTITHPDGEVVRVYKDERGQTNFTVADVPEGRELQYAGVANVIGNALRELNLEDVERADDGDGDAPPIEVEYRTFDGLVVRARGFERDDEAWMTFEASVDPEQAARFAPEDAGGEAADEASSGETEGDAAEKASPAGDTAAAADGAGDASATDAAAAAGEGEDAAAKAPDTSAVEAEAAAINERVAGWRYRIASYQFDQMTRRMEDLLKAEAEADDE
ncbi:MAG TPA: DUF4340 domain-containing protein [Gammaproteobacteria bacterium]